MTRAPRGLYGGPAQARLDRKGLRDASATLARAFQADPMMAYLIPDSLKRARILPWFLGTVVRYCLAYGEVHATPEGDAVACWLTPGNTTVTPARIFRTGGAMTPFKLGVGGFRRLMALQAYLGKEHAKGAGEPHFYLYLLGVDPLSRGRGLGRALLGPTLARADAEGVPCYLETQNEANLRVYASVGFRVASVGEVPGRDLTVWTMRREPQTSAHPGNTKGV